MAMLGLTCGCAAQDRHQVGPYGIALGQATGSNHERGTQSGVGLAGAVLEGFGNVLRANAVAGGEVSDGPGQLEHPVITASGERQLTDSRSHELLAGGIQAREELNFPRSHVGVGQDIRA